MGYKIISLRDDIYENLAKMKSKNESLLKIAL